MAGAATAEKAGIIKVADRTKQPDIYRRASLITTPMPTRTPTPIINPDTDPDSPVRVIPWPPDKPGPEVNPNTPWWVPVRRTPEEPTPPQTPTPD